MKLRSCSKVCGKGATDNLVRSQRLFSVKSNFSVSFGPQLKKKLNQKGTFSFWIWRSEYPKKSNICAKQQNSQPQQFWETTQWLGFFKISIVGLERACIPNLGSVQSLELAQKFKDYLMRKQRLFGVESNFSVSFRPRPKMNNTYSCKLLICVVHN